MTAGIIIIATLITCLEMPVLLKNGEKKTIWAFFILLVSGTALNIALYFKVSIPNPLDLIIFIYKPVADFIQTLIS